MTPSIKKLLLCLALACAVIIIHAQPKIAKVEWYVDTDPGYGNAEPVTIKSATDLANKTVKLDPADYTPGVHLFCIRAKDANDAWSLDNKWLFVIQSTAANVPKINYAEYYVDTDPGYGNAKKINITQGINLQNIKVDINPGSLSEGVHLFGVRAKDANGAWSLDNKWLFIISKPAAIIPVLKEVEFYIDKDPGYGKGTPIAFNSTKELDNFQLPVNVSALKAGDHVLYIRSRDANNSWSLDNVDTFNIPSIINPATIVINSITSRQACIGGNIKIAYQANGTYNADNTFKVQLSNKTGSFSNPTIIGTHDGKGAFVINCLIPPNTPTGSGYRVRVVSTSPVVAGLTSDSILTMNAGPAKPAITSVPPNTTNLCPGTSVKLTSSAATNLWNTGATTKSITVDSAGYYYVTTTNASGCSSASDSTAVSYSACAKPAALQTTGITAASATLSWKANTCAEKYNILYRVKGPGPFTKVSANGSSYILSGLTSSTEYEWKVQAVCDANDSSAFSKLVRFTTKASLANAVADDNLATNSFNARIIPNPAASEAYVYIQTESKKDVSVFLTDAAGKVLWSTEHTLSNKIKLPANSISNGAYFVMVISGDERKTLRFIKQQ